MSSYVRLPADRLAEMCTRCLEGVRAARESDWREAVARRRTELERSWWSKLWGSASPSDEEIERELRDPDDVFLFSERSWIDMRFHSSEAAAKRLLVATKHAAEVAVTTKDLELVDGW